MFYFLFVGYWMVIENYDEFVRCVPIGARVRVLSRTVPGYISDCGLIGEIFRVTSYHKISSGYNIVNCDGDYFFPGDLEILETGLLDLGELSEVDYRKLLRRCWVGDDVFYYMGFNGCRHVVIDDSFKNGCEARCFEFGCASFVEE
jgi:hypothetical protein